MARLPEPGETGHWGDVLNSFLRVEHKEDGSLKVRTDGTFYQKPTGGIPATDLTSAVQATLASAADDTAVVHTTSDETIAGTKTFTSPLVAQDRVAIGGAPAANALSVSGDFNIQDGVASKQYRFRTSGSALDLDAAGNSMHVSVYDNGDFTGTQRTYMVFGSGADYVTAFRYWEWKSSDYITRFSVDPEAHQVSLHGSTLVSVANPTNAQDAATKQYVDTSAPTVSTGSGAPATTPAKAGDMYVDTAGAKVYVATGTASSASWTALN
ncbi:MAG TPA: hypothetical protein VJ843_01200 [Candidatus Saccharimonadales bacterium]|nr:hypothetical protein [Candidatus Saccharimonadales bacterium]